MIQYNKADFERLVKDTLRDYHQYISSYESGWDIHKDEYGKPLFAAPYLSVTLKDDAEIIADLQDHKSIRIRQPQN